MKTSRLAAFLGILIVFLCIPVSLFAKKRLSDYSMRLQILQTRWNHNGWGFHAYGRANLFDQHGVPHGMEFTYDCNDHLMASSANEAYPARWVKQGRSIDVVFGEIGANPDSFHDCEFKISEKPFVFYRGRTVPAQQFLAQHPNDVPKVGPATPADVPNSANAHTPY
ncbi:MAG: hypothetical protein ACRD19_07615 [Terriglobia bacterium]